MSVLIWTQSACKGYKQITKVSASRQRVDMTKHLHVVSLNRTRKISIISEENGKNLERERAAAWFFTLDKRFDVSDGDSNGSISERYACNGK